MRTERESAIRLLQLLMVASLVFPAALFVYASYNDYRDVYAVADERIDRSLDVLQEQALKVSKPSTASSRRSARSCAACRTIRSAPRKQASPRACNASSGSCRRCSRSSRSAATAVRWLRACRRRCRRRRLCRSDLLSRRNRTATPEPMSATCIRRRRRPPGTDLFDVSRRLPSADGSFRGVIAIAVRPRYFDDFYSMIEQSPGNFYALARADGGLLARYPAGAAALAAAQSATACCGARSAAELAQGLYSVKSEVDGRNRRVGFRKAAGLSGLRHCRHRHRRDPRRMAGSGRRPSDLRPAGHAAFVLHALGGAAADQAPARRSGTPRIRRRRAAPGAAARSDRPIDRRRRARFQQSLDDRQRHGGAPAPPRRAARRRRNFSTPSPMRRRAARA